MYVCVCMCIYMTKKYKDSSNSLVLTFLVFVNWSLSGSLSNGSWVSVLISLPASPPQLYLPGQVLSQLGLGIYKPIKRRYLIGDSSIIKFWSTERLMGMSTCSGGGDLNTQPHMLGSAQMNGVQGIERCQELAHTVRKAERSLWPRLACRMLRGLRMTFLLHQRIKDWQMEML